MQTRGLDPHPVRLPPRSGRRAKLCSEYPLYHVFLYIVVVVVYKGLIHMSICRPSANDKPCRLSVVLCFTRIFKDLKGTTGLLHYREVGRCVCMHTQGNKKGRNPEGLRPWATALSGTIVSRRPCGLGARVRLRQARPRIRGASCCLACSVRMRCWRAPRERSGPRLP